MGYTELGNWVYHFDDGKNYYIDELDIDDINLIRRENGFNEVTWKKNY